MADLIEQSEQLIQLQAELERLKNGADTIHEFSTSAMRAVEFVNQSQSDYQQTKETIQVLEKRLAELKDALGDSRLADIGAIITRIEASNAGLKSQIDVTTTAIDQLKAEIIQLKSLWEGKITELSAQVQKLGADRQTADNVLGERLNNIRSELREQTKTDIEQAVKRLANGMNKRLTGELGKSDVNTTKLHQALDQKVNRLNIFMLIVIMLVIGAIFASILPAVIG